MSHQGPAVEACRGCGKHVSDTTSNAVGNEAVFQTAPYAQIPNHWVDIDGLVWVVRNTALGIDAPHTGTFGMRGFMRRRLPVLATLPESR